MNARGRSSSLALALTALLGACGGTDAAPDVEDKPSAPPNVLLITLDTVRVDRLGAFGNTERDVTPRLDELARESLIYTEAYANSSFTPPSHASILTGRYPEEHGLMHWSQRLLDLPTAADRFASAGYRTLAVTPLVTLFKVGLDRGFETTVSPPYETGDGLLLLADAARLNAEALPALLADDERPYFAWLHYYDAHRVFGRQGPEWARRYNEQHDPAVGATETWYQLRPEASRGKLAQSKLTSADRRFMADRYDGGLAYLDAQLGELFAQLRGDPRWANTIVVVTADHGEVFDEHAEEWYSHDPYLFRENLHVPLILRLPDGAAERATGARDELVQGVDVLPTLLDLAGLPHDPNDFTGLSLRPTFARRSLRRPSIFADRMGRDDTAKPGADLAEALAARDRKRMVRTETHELIHYVDQERFELHAVHDEHVDLFGRDRQLDERMIKLYQRELKRQTLLGARAASGLSDTDAQLCALGYVDCEEDR